MTGLTIYFPGMTIFPVLFQHWMRFDNINHFSSAETLSPLTAVTDNKVVSTMTFLFQCTTASTHTSHAPDQWSSIKSKPSIPMLFAGLSSATTFLSFYCTLAVKSQVWVVIYEAIGSLSADLGNHSPENGCACLDACGLWSTATNRGNVDCRWLAPRRNSECKPQTHICRPM